MIINGSKGVESCRELKFARRSYWGAIERCPQQSDLDGSKSYRASIEHTETSLMDREAVEKLSRQILKIPFSIAIIAISFHQAYRNFFDGSRSYREAIETNSQKARWNEIAIIAIDKGSSKGSTNSLVVERCREVVEIAQKQFFKKRKPQIWIQSNKLLNQRSKQHFILSKTSLNKKKNVKHKDPKTHTHTHNKSK